MDGLAEGLAAFSIDDFYYLARLSLVKDERFFDRFDRIFSEHFAGIESDFADIMGEVPEDWLRQQAELLLSDEEKAKLEALGGLDELMETLRKRLEEQSERHQGGSKWIGTGGTSPFGHGGYNPMGVRIGGSGGQRRAVKVWERRDYRNLDDTVELGTRNIKVALRRLRRFAREGAADQLDLDATIGATARNGGLLDLKLVPERHNAARVLLFLDVGGSMDGHVRSCEELFSATRSEFKHLEHFYFHNFIYENVWRDNSRRRSEIIPINEILRTFGNEYKLIFVGDAAMSPFEITHAGGSIEHYNQESGAQWITRLLSDFPYAIWLNPEPQERWPYLPSIELTRELLKGRMFPLTIDGLDRGIDQLKRQTAVEA